MLWKGAKTVAMRFLDVRTVTAPAAAPIFSTLRLVRLFLPRLALLSLFPDFAMEALLFRLHSSLISKAAPLKANPRYGCNHYCFTLFLPLHFGPCDWQGA